MDIILIIFLLIFLFNNGLTVRTDTQKCTGELNSMNQEIRHSKTYMSIILEWLYYIFSNLSL